MAKLDINKLMNIGGPAATAPTPAEVFDQSEPPTPAAASMDPPQADQQKATDAPQVLALQQEQEERARLREVYATYQDNIKTSAALQTQIVKAIKNGEPLETVLYMALECVGRMTGNNLFSNACIKAIEERKATQPTDQQATPRPDLDEGDAQQVQAILNNNI